MLGSPDLQLFIWNSFKHSEIGYVSMLYIYFLNINVIVFLLEWKCVYI